jgi:hypothetical protein
LIPLTEVVKAVEKEYSFVRARIRSMPSSMAQPLAILTEPRQVFERLTEAVVEWLSELTADSNYEQSRQQLESKSVVSTGENSESGTEADTEAESGGVGGHISISESRIE